MSVKCFLTEISKHRMSGGGVNLRSYSRHVEYHPQLKTKSIKVKEATAYQEEMIRRSRTPLPKLEDIKIPQRIERGPTDILKALSSTVGKDYTAPHYRFHDDPYLIPVSNAAKRAFALSKESGKKAAQFIKQQHADLFQHKEADPPIQAFIPKPVLTEESDVSEEDLIDLIQQGHLFDSIKAYNIMKSKGKDLSEDAKQAFLELLCYSNEVELVDEELIEERWYKAGLIARERPKNTWKERGLAESLFQEMENKDIRAYCAVIRGRAKFYQCEKAWQLYQEVLGQGQSVDVDTFNQLLRVVNFLKESSDLRWQLVQQLLTDMKVNDVRPNVGTLNAVLETVSQIGNPKLARTYSLQALSEFKRNGIDPSLASYYYLLITFCKDRGPPSTILADILKELQGKEIKVQDPKDTFFFITAMDVARHHLQNLELAEALNELLHTGDNYDLIGDSFKESIYYRHFIALKCNMEPFDKFMEYYDKIVPNIYTPEPGIMEEILKAMELNSAVHHLPKFWSDMVIFDHTNRESLLTLVLNVISNHFPILQEGEVSSEAATLARQFSEISWKIWMIIENQDRERQKQISWSGKMLGDLLTIQLRSENYKNACEVMKKLVGGSQDVLGVPAIESLRLFLDTAIKNNHGSMCLACVHYINEAGFPDAVDFAQEVHEKVELDSIQVAKLSNIVGFDLTARSRLSVE